MFGLQFAPRLTRRMAVSHTQYGPFDWPSRSRQL